MESLSYVNLDSMRVYAIMLESSEIPLDNCESGPFAGVIHNFLCGCHHGLSTLNRCALLYSPLHLDLRILGHTAPLVETNNDYVTETEVRL